MKFIFPLFIVFLCYSIEAQEAKPTQKDTVPFIFVGTATGVNNLCGMAGVVVGIKANDEFFFKIGYGIGGWGRKFSAGFNYELKTTNSWAFGMSYSSCSGDKKLTT